MNYIILNGVDSRNIPGLLIQYLPPISKPRMRTQIEEIDGRDGDIVTKLGYSAYDKPLKIGLCKNYDINRIISFFDGEGNVTFSDEPDKYYRYQIIEQIDFERLIRFREAVVTLHCQPFKYSRDDSADINYQLIKYQTFAQTKNGVTVNVRSDGLISITGTASEATDFYIPIDPITLTPDQYELAISANGDNTSSCYCGLINNNAAAGNIFGGRAIMLSDNWYVSSIEETITNNKPFNYVYLIILPNVEINAKAWVVLWTDPGTAKFTTLTNRGNEQAKPKYTLYGMGQVKLYVNDYQILDVVLGDEEYITIDSENFDAYNSTGKKNRLINGDYERLWLHPGENEIRTVMASRIVINDYSRWI